MSGEPFREQAAHLNQEARADWEQIAGWWDAQVGEDANLAVRPAVRRLLELRPDERVLELACGNGALARELARDGARVLATDFSSEFLRLAEERTRAYPDLAEQIEYRLVDATDPAQLAALGQGQDFDAAVCVMGLMDMPAIDPLMSAVAHLLKPNGRFVWTVVHPCFNTRGVSMVAEQEDREGELVTTYAIKMRRYLEPLAARGLGIVGQPVPHYSFERPLSVLFASGFRAGLVLDGLEEIAASPPADPSQLRIFSWARIPDIPLFLVGRMRPRSG
jgi:2-polyprenyl-3-methyl-5-hydroxy-6-metoxy-1,4-benzoquinol methylase